jgi:DNA polymerase-3 subunit delta
MFVVYGPDRGLVAERAGAIAGTTGVDLNDGFALIRLDISDIQSDPGRLVDEVNAFGLFGGEKLIWVRGAANEKQLVDGLSHLAANPPEGSYLLIEAGDLKKGSALRKVAEGERSIACIACYQDDARALNALIDTELSAANLRITPAARELLVESIGGDRIASRNEIQKLVLYCMKDDLIDERHVLEIVGDASAVSTDEVVDAVLSGDPDGFLHAIQKVIASKTAVFLVLQGTMKQIQLLETMRLEMEERQQQAAQVMQTLGRGIHFKRKPIIEKALRNWNSADLARESARLNAAILQSRQNAPLEDNLAIQTLLATTLQSARRNRQG